MQGRNGPPPIVKRAGISLRGMTREEDGRGRKEPEASRAQLRRKAGMGEEWRLRGTDNHTMAQGTRNAAR